ncbi:UspA domain protein [Desulfosarcina variabilis str. Montpellier]|uniref:universal stress protein n=1 Tax=Desulfosarcina variabilis TaxID=2300 RepID=UPI003AFA65C0
MEKKVLIAVDDSRHSENALRYVAGLSESVSEMKFVLFHVQPTISQYLMDEARTKPSAYAELKKLEKKAHQTAQDLLQKDKALMISLGIAEENVQAITLPRKFGAAKDILEYGTALLYDAIVVGRRGVSGLAEVFMGSVSASVLDNSEVLPVWVIDEKAPPKGVMVAVDGSGSSLRAVDHLAFIFSGNSDITISFFHVAPRLADFCPIDFSKNDSSQLESVIEQGDRACIDRFYAHALKKFADAGISERQIHIDVHKGGFKVGKIIMDTYRKGGFGTLIVGRRGMNKKFFAGSVSRYLVNQFSGGALWVVP